MICTKSSSETFVCFQFRLKSCGLRRPIYLIEDYGSIKNYSIPEQTLKQAIANTQVSDVVSYCVHVLDFAFSYFML